MVVAPLKDLRVLQLDGGIEVAYCTKVLADAGADVVFVEPATGHPLRHRSVSGADLSGRSSPLFEYLHCSKRGVTDPGPDRGALYERADAVVTDHLQGTWESLHERFPHLSVVVVSPFGTGGPWASRPATDLTLQAASGGMAPRGAPGLAPLMVGGDPSYWFAGSVAAVSLLGVLGRIRRTGVGELIDVSMLETTHLEHGMYPVTFNSMAGRPFQTSRGVPVPGIEPTADGWVGFFVITGQQWLDFCALIGKPEWQQDESLFIAVQRRLRADELVADIRDWTRQRTTAEIVETASLMRIPVAPIGNGETVTSIDHFVAEEWFVRHPDGFVQPRRPYRFGREPIGSVVPARTVGDASQIAWEPRPRPRPDRGSTGADLPLSGVRVADFTGFWAGPMASGILAGLGADVIHIEGPRRPDGIRMNTIRSMDEPQWWEWSPLFCGANTNKRAITLDLSDPQGHGAALRLLGTCDVMFENFSPRVVEQLGLGPDAVLAANPRIVMVRMPAFGLEGPWRDRVGFAQTIEQACGLAFLTGYEGDAPVIPNGMCDPLAGVHGAIAALVALAERDRTGSPQVVEAPMVGAGLAVAAEQVVEFSAFGHLQRSTGNSSPRMFQGVFRCSGDDEWVAVCLPDEPTNRAALTLAGVDPDGLEDWCSSRPADEAAEALRAAGAIAARVHWAHEVLDNPQLRQRGFFEQLDHPLCGRHTYTSWPARMSAGPSTWNRVASPTMGQHNEQVLAELGFAAAEIDEMRRRGVISAGVLTDQHGW